MVDYEALALTVDDAAREAREIPQLSHSFEFSLADAYEIQKRSLARRYERGETPIGVKLGFTSRAKMVQMGLSDMIWGRLTDAMLVPDGGRMEINRYVHPRAEPEIAFLLKRRLEGRVTLPEALSAVEAIAPAIEIIDSRYANFKFSLPDVVADNTSSSSLVVGPWCRPDADFSNLGMVLEFDGRPRQIGSSAAVMGHPLRALADAVTLLDQQGLALEAGWLVMSGGATAAEALAVNVSVRVSIEKLGTASFFVR